MDLKIVSVEDVKFAMSARTQASRELLLAIKKVEADHTKAIILSPNGSDLKKLNNKVRSKIAHWKKETGEVPEQITANLTEDKKVVVFWRAKKRKGGEDAVA